MKHPQNRGRLILLSLLSLQLLLIPLGAAAYAPYPSEEQKAANEPAQVKAPTPTAPVEAVTEKNIWNMWGLMEKAPSESPPSGPSDTPKIEANVETISPEALNNARDLSPSPSPRAPSPRDLHVCAVSLVRGQGGSAGDTMEGACSTNQAITSLKTKSGNLLDHLYGACSDLSDIQGANGNHDEYMNFGGGNGGSETVIEKAGYALFGFEVKVCRKNTILDGLLGKEDSFIAEFKPKFKRNWSA